MVVLATKVVVDDSVLVIIVAIAVSVVWLILLLNNNVDLTCCFTLESKLELSDFETLEERFDGGDEGNGG